MMQVNGVDLGKVDRVHLARIAAQVGAKVPAGATTQRLVEEVGKVFARTPSNLAGPCDNCGGMSDSALQECPFCGVGEENEIGAIDDDEVAIEEPLAYARSKNPAKNSVVTLQPSNAEVLPGLMGIAISGEKKLDDALARIDALKAGATVNLWKLGREIKTIYDAQLWLQRTKEGKPAYKSFEAFVHGELKGMSKTTAYWLQDIAEAFDEKEVLIYGRTKLALILKAPKEDRSLLLDKVKAGIPSRALSDDVDKARAAAGEFVRETSRTTDSLGRDTAEQRAGLGKRVKGKKPRKTKGDSITIAKTFGKQQVKMWVRSEKKGEAPTKRARKIGDKPIGTMDLDNGVQMHFALVTSSAGELILSVETRRPES